MPKVWRFKPPWICTITFEISKSSKLCVGHSNAPAIKGWWDHPHLQIALISLKCLHVQFLESVLKMRLFHPESWACYFKRLGWIVGRARIFHTTPVERNCPRMTCKWWLECILMHLRNAKKSHFTQIREPPSRWKIGVITLDEFNGSIWGSYVPMVLEWCDDYIVGRLNLVQPSGPSGTKMMTCCLWKSRIFSW